MRKFGVLAVAALLAAFVAVPALGSTAPKKVSVGPTSKPLAFSPKTLKIKRGTKVTWSWGPTGINHNVTVTRGPVKFHSKTMTKGNFSHVFTKRGTYSFVCTIHKAVGMKMTITVS